MTGAALIPRLTAIESHFQAILNGGLELGGVGKSGALGVSCGAGTIDHRRDVRFFRTASNGFAVRRFGDLRKAMDALRELFRGPLRKSRILSLSSVRFFRKS